VEGAGWLRLVASNHSDHFAACRTFFLPPGEVLRDTAAAESVAAWQPAWLRNLVHTDDAVILTSHTMVCSSSGYGTGLTRGCSGRRWTRGMTELRTAR